MIIIFFKGTIIIILFPMFYLINIRDHFLKLLLIFEIVILIILILIRILNFEIEPLFFFVFLSIRACEASIGLACLVLLLRSEGNDFVYLLESIQS